MAKMKFKETQRYRQWDIIALVAVLCLGTAIQLGVSLVTGSRMAFGSTTLGFMVLVSLLLILFYFLKAKMKVRVSAKGVKYSIFPWTHNWNKIKWEEVADYELVELPSTAVLSGGAVRYNVISHGWSIGCRRGIRLDLHNGESYFLSIDRLEDLKQILEKISEQQPIGV